MIFLLLAFAIGAVLVWLAYNHVPMAPARISGPVPAYDNQFEVFRDMEPADQTRENSWIGFLQENVRSGRTGPIGDFIGNEDAPTNAPLFEFDLIQDVSAMETTPATEGQPTSKVVTMDAISGVQNDLGPGTYPIGPTVTSMKVYPPLVVVVSNAAGIKQTTNYVAGNGMSLLTLDKSYNFNKITISLP
jgi:hypothetical protein